MMSDHRSENKDGWHAITFAISFFIFACSLFLILMFIRPEVNKFRERVYLDHFDRMIMVGKESLHINTSAALSVHNASDLTIEPSLAVQWSVMICNSFFTLKL